MAALADIYIKKETLETLLKTIQAKQEKGVAITISLNDETNSYGQNVSSFVSQSKEDREAQKKKFYVGNGKVFWHNDKITKAEQQQSQPRPIQEVQSSHDVEPLPF